MSVLKLGNFGGLYPAVSERVLANEAATTAMDLVAGTMEFRPLRDHTDVLTLGTSNPKTLHRFARTAGGDLNTDMSSGWRAYSAYTNLVKGQINDDKTERTYLTDGAGAYPPRVIDVTGQDRKLGVPPPSTAVTCTVTVGEYFTPEDRDKAIADAKAATTKALTDHRARASIGATAPGLGTSGFLDRQEYTAAIGTQQLRILGLAADGSVSDSFVTAGAAAFAWTLLGTVPSERLDAPPASAPAWMTPASSYLALAYDAYGLGWTLDGAAAKADIMAILKPGTEDFLYDEAKADALVALVQDVLDPTKGAASVVAPLAAKVDEITALLKEDGASGGGGGGFYDKPDVASEVQQAIDSFASDLYGAASSSGQAFAMGHSNGIECPLTYAAGVVATAMANIDTAVRDAWVADASGARTLNRTTLRNWVAADWENGIGPDPETTTAVGVAMRFSLEGWLTKLANILDPAHWQVRGDWPADGGAVPSPGDKPTRLATLRAEATKLSGAVTAYYDTLTAEGGPIDVALGKFYGAGEWGDGIPDAEQKRNETRAYIATYVTDWDEESMPCAASELVTMAQNDAIAITVAAPPAGRNITHWRLYRSNSSNESAAWQYVPHGTDSKGIPIAELDFTDEVLAEALQEVCPTTTWAEPPENLQGLVGLPNGIMAGFFGNTVCFCEPYQPYAWPVEYQVTVEWPIVGLGVWGQTLLVATRGQPYFVGGADSASMSAQKLDSNQACVSARSICPTSAGVVYASPDGLCLASNSGVQLVTAAHFTREEWIALGPESLFTAEHDGTVYLFFAGTGGEGGGGGVGGFDGAVTTVFDPLQAASIPYAEQTRNGSGPKFLRGPLYGFSPTGWTFNPYYPNFYAAYNVEGDGVRYAAGMTATLSHGTVTNIGGYGLFYADFGYGLEGRLGYWKFVYPDALVDVGGTPAAPTYALNMGNGKLVTMDVQASTVYSDLITDRLYVADGATLKALFAGTKRRVAVWESKAVVLESYKSFAWLAVESDFKDADGTTVPVDVEIYGDLDDEGTRELIYGVTVTGRRPVRVPAKRAKEYLLSLRSAARVTAMVVASSTAELQSV